MIAKFGMYLQYPFVRYALIVSVLVALCSALLGVTLVLRRFSFIGDGLSHVAFGAMSVATVMNLTNEMLLILPVTVISAILLLRKGKNAKIKGDAAIAMISVAALAFGYLLVNVFSASSNISGDVCSTLFGSTSILTLSVREVWLSVILSVAVVVIFVLCYNKIFAVTFDEDFSRAAGVRADQYNLLIAVITAVIIVRPVRDADLPQLPARHHLLRGAFSGMFLYRDRHRDPCRDSCGVHDRGGPGDRICRMLRRRCPHAGLCLTPREIFGCSGGNPA